MYYKKIKYNIDENNQTLNCCLYSNRLSAWILIAQVKANSRGSLTIRYYGETGSIVHFNDCDTAQEARQDIMQFIHCEFEIVNEPDDFDEIINSWKLMSEINRQVKEQ